MEQNIIKLNIEPDYDNIVSSLSNVNVPQVVLVQEMINNSLAAVDEEIMKNPDRKDYDLTISLEHKVVNKEYVPIKLVFEDDVSGIPSDKLDTALSLRHRAHGTSSDKNEHNNGLKLAIAKWTRGYKESFEIENTWNGQKSIIDNIRQGEQDILVEQVSLNDSGFKLTIDNPDINIFIPNDRSNSKYNKFVDNMSSKYSKALKYYKSIGKEVTISIRSRREGHEWVTKHLQPVECPVYNPDTDKDGWITSFTLKMYGHEGTVSFGKKRENDDELYSENIYSDTHPYKIALEGWGNFVYKDNIPVCGGMAGMYLLGLKKLTDGGNRGFYNRIHIETELGNTFVTTNTKDNVRQDPETMKWFHHVGRILRGEEINPTNGKKKNYISEHFKRDKEMKENDMRDSIFRGLNNMPTNIKFKQLSKEASTKSGSRLDLYFIDDGKRNIFELKKDNASRDHVNQCMGYISEILDLDDTPIVLTLLVGGKIDQKIIDYKDKFLDKFAEKDRIQFDIEQIKNHWFNYYLGGE